MGMEDWRVKTIEYLNKRIDSHELQVEHYRKQLNSPLKYNSQINYISKEIAVISDVIFELENMVWDLNQELGGEDG